mgnify:CR=1 FL=1
MPAPLCLLFDSDGTLVDSEILLAEVMAEVLPRHGLPFTTFPFTTLPFATSSFSISFPETPPTPLLRFLRNPTCDIRGYW